MSDTAIQTLISIAAVITAVAASVVGIYQVLRSSRTLSKNYEVELKADQPSAAAGGISGRDTYKILAKYSAQGLAQSQISFMVSIIFASLGFLVILGGVGVAIFANKSTATAVIPVISGAVVDAVAGLFFTVNSRTQKVMVDFFDKLRSDRRVEDAMEIASKLPDSVMGSKLQALLALNFTQVNDIPELFRQLIDSETQQERGAGKQPGPTSSPSLEEAAASRTSKNTSSTRRSQRRTSGNSEGQ
jgi:hypothetical protein